MRSSSLQALVVVAGLIGCSPSAFRGPAKRLDVLTAYTLALSKRDYREAARFLAPVDRAKICGPETGILPEYRERVLAIRRTTLLSNPLIEVKNGLIYGIPDVLPVLDLGRAVSLQSPLDEDIVPLPVPDKIPQRIQQEDLRRATQGFFQAVSRRKWKQALSYVNEKEQQDFLDAKGSVKQDAAGRLAAVDTSEWQALTLRDGKLTGIVLIIPEPESKRLY